MRKACLGPRQSQEDHHAASLETELYYHLARRRVLVARYACQVHEEEKGHGGRALEVPEAVCDEGLTGC